MNSILAVVSIDIKTVIKCQTLRIIYDFEIENANV